MDIQTNNPYLDRIHRAWNHLTPWQQKKMFIKAMWVAFLAKRA